MLPSPAGFFEQLGEAVFLEPGKLVQFLAAEFDEGLDFLRRDPREIRTAGVEAVEIHPRPLFEIDHVDGRLFDGLAHRDRAVALSSRADLCPKSTTMSPPMIKEK